MLINKIQIILNTKTHFFKKKFILYNLKWLNKRQFYSGVTKKGVGRNTWRRRNHERKLVVVTLIWKSKIDYFTPYLGKKKLSLDEKKFFILFKCHQKMSSFQNTSIWLKKGCL